MDDEIALVILLRIGLRPLDVFLVVVGYRVPSTLHSPVTDRGGKFSRLPVVSLQF